MRSAITPLPSGGRVFTGQRDDPFFVDLGATFDAINIDKPGRQGKVVDDLAGYGVHSIVLQVPERDVTKDGEQETLGFQDVSVAEAATAV